MGASGGTDDERVELESPDLAADRRAALEDLFPGALADGVLDPGRIAELLDVSMAQVPDGRERYGLQWAGKQEAIRSLLTPSQGTLVPDLENSIDFDTAENVFIVGDNLEVLKLLQKAYNDKVKLIYIDPPYNTGNDFVYNDNFSDGLRGYLEYTGQLDNEGNRTSADADTAGRKHSRWLSMMYPRLVLARNLLTQDGAIAISIDDVEVANLRGLMDLVFGPENFVAQLIWKSKSGGANDSRWFATDHEYVLVYARSAGDLTVEQDPDAEVTTSYPYTDERGSYGLERLDKQSLGYLVSLDYPITGPDEAVYVVEQRDPRHPNARWRWSRATVAERFNELVFKDGRVYTKNYSKAGAIPRSMLSEERFGRTRTGKTELAKLVDGAPFDNPKPPQLIRFLVNVLTRPGDLVLDFFAGSGTTGDAVYRASAEGVGRRWLLVQLPESPAPGSQAAQRGYRVISDVTRERLVAAAKAQAVEPSMRVLELGASNFRHPATSETQLDLGTSTLAQEETENDAIAAEVLLKEGVPLDTPWQRFDMGGADVIVAGGVAVVITLDIHDDLVADALGLDVSVVVFLEDGFADADAIKANAVTNARALNKTLKTV